MAEDEVKDFIPDGEFTSDEDKYGGVGGTILSGSLGALRSATLGLSDVALTKTGMMSPEEMAGREAANPIASGVGEVAGFFAPTGVGGLIGKAGKAVVGGVKALKAAQTVHEVSTAAKVLGAVGDIGAHALGSSVEGAIYSGVGNSLHEYALGDPNLNGEKILSNFGAGALWGGGLGGALKTVTTIMPPALGAIKDALKKVKSTIMGTGEGEGGLFGKALEMGGAKPETVEGWSNRISNLDVDQKVKIAQDATKDLNTLHKNVQTAVKDLNKEIRPQEVDALINQVDKEKVLGFRQEFLGQMESSLEQMRNEPERYSKAVVKDAEDVLKLAQKSPTFDSKDAFNFLREAKQKLNDIVYETSGFAPREERKAVEVIDGLRRTLNDGLKNPEVFGDVGARLAEHDDKLSKLYSFVSPSARSGRGATDFQKTFGNFVMKGGKSTWEFDQRKLERVFKRADNQKEMNLLHDFYRTIEELPDHIETTYNNVPNQRFDAEALKNIISNSESSIEASHLKYKSAIEGSKSNMGLSDLGAAAIATAHPLVGAAIKSYNIVTKPIENMAKLAQVERAVGQATAKISTAAKKVFEPTIDALSKAIGPTTRIINDDHDFEDAKKELLTLANDPNVLVDRLHSSTKEFSNVAPDTTNALQMTSQRALSFLITKLPGPKEDLGPFQNKYKPSNTELSNFNNYYSVVENPNVTLHQLASGTLTPQTMEVMHYVYPQLLQHMQTQVLNEATKRIAKGQAVPYKTKQSLTYFLGRSLDTSMMPQNIMRNQMMMNRPLHMPNMKPKKSSGSSKMTLSQRTGLNTEEEPV